MEGYRGIATASAVALYLAFCIAIGVWSGRRSKTSLDFFMAGRNLGVILTSLAIFSTSMSGVSFVGGPGLVYSMGMSSMWILASAVSGGLVSYLLVAKRLRLFAELRSCVSLPDVVAARYGSEAVRGWVAIAIVLGVLGYLATQILAMGVVLQGILTDAGLFGSVSVEACVFIACFVLLFYSVAGGMLATVYTAALQGGIMLVASFLVFLTVMGSFEGGLLEMATTVTADDPEAMGPWGTLGMFGCLSWFFVFGVGLPGQPHIVTKWMMVRRVPDIRRIFPLGILGNVIGALLWVGVGLAVRALVINGGMPALDSPDLAAPTFIRMYAHPLLAALVFSALIAAIMSSADSFLNIGTAALVHDLPRAFAGKQLKRELLWARVVTAVLAVVATAFALYTGDLVALLGAFGWGTFAAALVPVIGIGLNWKRATATAAVVSIVASLVINFSVKLSGYSMPHQLDVGAVSLVVSLVLFVGVSLMTKPQKLAADVQAVMDF